MQLAGNKGKYANPLQCAVEISRTRGILALYRGLPALVIGTASKGAVRFTVFEWVRWALGEDHDGIAGGWKNGIAGTATGIVEAVLVVTPTEAIKTRLIADQNTEKPRFRGMLHGTATIFKEEGLGGIYRGATAVIARQAANQAVRFTVYGTLKDVAEKKLRDGNQTSAIPWWVHFINGSISNVITTYATNPLDVIKTRMQAHHEKSNLFHVFRSILKEEGGKAFWRGVTPRLGRMIIAGGVIFTVYEETCTILQKIGM
ncbi:uncharacterized protein SPPG_06669 [Spizellomyces punctatus DAOM BR117]|uniref:Uncharacterized protein n=1 Tax=Spizellomyces punctatus (strain DAOM BR117) TaxID=645134 RepID=A0A0L0HBF8_SPIPD|nr:uncharacterized protein SPPG_06669 [Spizellomyces punctatus DAOM BR117]KNC98271.1 hypothetical protein SPPG_06669 [Spizellomyces punctatus DAOM BR117]|eukprot:XP_016606311.1 hypothetical protein SPPG_06669 [Spizellomyces punctatus DAOM BR117]